MATSTYHGPLPQSKADFKMAKKHLKDTYKLNKQKIKDHQKAAKATTDSKSIAYNTSHLNSHKKDNTKITASLGTLSNLKPIYNKFNKA